MRRRDLTADCHMLASRLPQHQVRYFSLCCHWFVENAPAFSRVPRWHVMCDTGLWIFYARRPRSYIYISVLLWPLIHLTSLACSSIDDYTKGQFGRRTYFAFYAMTWQRSLNSSEEDKTRSATNPSLPYRVLFAFAICLLFKSRQSAALMRHFLPYKY